MLKHERHSHHQAESMEELPQHISDWVDGGIAVCVYCVWHVYLLCTWPCSGTQNPYSTTLAPFPLQTLFFSTHINTSHIYQYSLSLILKLFLSYSFVLLPQSLNLIITTNLPQTSTLMPNPSYAELLHMFFCSLYISNIKRPNHRSSLLQSWSSLLTTVFFQSWDWTFKL